MKNISEVIDNIMSYNDRGDLLKKLIKILELPTELKDITDIDLLNDLIRDLVIKMNNLIEDNDIPLELNTINKYYHGNDDKFLDYYVHYQIDNPDGSNNPFIDIQSKKVITGNQALDFFLNRYYSDDIDNEEDLITVYWQLVADNCYSKYTTF